MQIRSASSFLRDAITASIWGLAYGAITLFLIIITCTS